MMQINRVSKGPTDPFVITLIFCVNGFHNYFGQTYIIRNFFTRKYITNPHYAICVPALPCKILITTLVMSAAILVHWRSLLHSLSVQ